MERELVGYLLNSLDEPTRAEVAARLETDAQLQGRLDLLRRAMEPLEADHEAAAPPPGLIARTIGLVAEHICRPMPKAPAPASDAPTISGPWWRRVDVLLAASLLIAVVGLAAPMIFRSHQARSNNMQCQENLRTLFVALEEYHDRKGSYPNVAGEKPRHAAGMALPLLKHGVFKPKKPIVCPGMQVVKPSDLPLDELRKMDIDAFASLAPNLNPSYAYSLGFVDTQGYQAPSRIDGARSMLPLMSDAPSCDGEPGNSPNHACHGQNVLFQDGHVKFVTSRMVGFEGDDIYLNKARRIAAGLDRMDAVLGCSAAKP